MPYLSGKVGLGFNKAKSFSIEPKIVPEVPAPGFGSHTATAFSYAIGLGVQKELITNLHLGVGYEFADWGNSHLAAAPGQTINSGLQLNHLYTNGLQLSLNYII